MPIKNSPPEWRGVVALQISCLELRRTFHHRHVLRSRFCDVDYILQLRLCAIGIHILLAVQDTAFAGDAAQVAAIPTDGEMAVFNLPDVIACSLQTNGSFFKVAKLRHIILLVHINFLLQKNKPERTWSLRQINV